MEEKKLVDMVLAEPEKYETLLKEVKDVINLYRASKNDCVDYVIWRGIPLLKEGGEAILDAFAQIKEGDEKQNLIDLKKFWVENYERINKEIYKLD